MKADLGSVSIQTPQSENWEQNQWLQIHTDVVDAPVYLVCTSDKPPLDWDISRCWAIVHTPVQPEATSVPGPWSKDQLK